MSEYIKKQLIYRYRAVTEHTVLELMSDDFVLSSSDTFNDEHDMAISFDLEKAYNSFKSNEKFLKKLSEETAARRKKSYEERLQYLQSSKGAHIVKVFTNYLFTTYVKSLKSKLLVGCFTDVYDNGAMWAHYSSNGKGFVVGYDKAAVESSINNADAYRGKSFFEEVIYGEKPYDITDTFVNYINKILENNDSFLIDNSEFLALNLFILEDNKELNDSLIRKNSVWSYEREKRIIAYNLESRGRQHVSMAKVKPEIVILGEKMTLPDKYLIVSICVKKGIELFVVEPSYRKEDFKIGIRPLLSIEIDHLLNSFADYLKLDGLVN